ncbi:MAG: 16S rRNA (adenine(1518)-N(6)/adenine(1519)-N(6))-dimethyltransferase RsmA [Oscillospiraceae bacterium]|nr:16S rRNA (adenine(1518)-N(6)/adenine(1519)-N(6))-dimethyltransferase RsmA [Oscillospiraceae bacterium]
MALTDRAYLKDLLSRHGFTFSKAMGQNFLINPSVCPRMAEFGGASEGVGVIEIGPGVGVLTQQLAERADKVVCIELDERLPPILAETLADYDNVEIILGDVMEVDLEKIIAERFAGMPVYVCANLPYYITTPILMRLLEAKLPIEAVTVMVQKEAAQRLCAEPGERECGAISAAVWYFSEPKPLFSVSAGSFMPAPNVDSAVIRLDIRKEPPVSPKNEKLMFEVVKGAFSQRRKTAANAISSYLKKDKSEVIKLLESCGLDPAVRAERLTLSDFAAIADAFEAV